MNLILPVRKLAFREVETCPRLTEGSRQLSKDLLPFEGPRAPPSQAGSLRAVLASLGCARAVCLLLDLLPAQGEILGHQLLGKMKWGAERPRMPWPHGPVGILALGDPFHPIPLPGLQPKPPAM